MTGFASETGAKGGLSWTVEIRGVNAKGLDIRVRAPERMVGFDQKLKAEFQKALERGSVAVSLRYEQEDASGALRVDEAVLAGYLEAAKLVQNHATEAGVAIAPTDLLTMRGVIVSGDEAVQLPPEDAVLETARAALSDFVAMRAREGSALSDVLLGNLQEIEALTVQAAGLAEARKDDVAKSLKINLARILDNAEGVDADRVAQELAMLAVKADVTEEIDRLHAHVTAARDLLATPGSIGRKLDFLMQEFNREANTLCSKSGSTALTRVGLDLKALIDQMREQVQNVE